MPSGEFCTRCGAHAERGPLRVHRFVLWPAEHVAAPHVLSTLLPRLSHERGHAFRWGVLGGAALVALLATTGLVAAALWVAAVLVPLLYLSYMREVDVFADAPVLVLGATVASGAAVGVVVTVVANRVGSGLGASGVILLLAVTAVIAEALKPAAPLALLRRRFPSTVDGLVFGVAAGAGYALAQTVVNLAGPASSGGFRVAPSGWLPTLLSVGVLIPLVHGSCSGLVAAALWRRGGADGALRRVGLPLAVIADVAFTAGSEVLDDARLGAVAVLLWQAATVAAVLVAVRMLLHAAILEEGAELGLHEVRCASCGRAVEAAAYCPACGAAIAAPLTARRPRAAAG